MYQWRRRAKPPLAWIFGTLVLHADDIEFVDLHEQPRYSPPDRGDLPNLEAELACLPAFEADLRDDAFAMTAFYMLSKREWMKIGHREAETFLGDGDVAGMIAGLRAKGEIYLDVEYGTLSGREEPLDRGIFSEDRVQRLHRRLASVGWRTHTPDEIRAILREDLQRRLRTRVELLRQVKELELRQAGSFLHWKETPRLPPLRVSIFRDGDDPAWLGVLSPEEQEACSGELSLRISALAVSARIDRDEHQRLINALVQ
jgi:hypothetical protein